jgi:large subunit ribosomal protein L21
MYAVIETGGKQFKVQEGDSIRVEKLEGAPASKLTLDKILLVVKDGQVSIGQPYVKDVTVSSTKVEDDKNKKLIIYKYKRRKDFDKKKGHRQTMSVLKIDKINA